MYPAEFDYVEAESVDHALDLLAEHADAETELLAGGHSLLPTMKTGLATPDVVVDIGQIEAMQGIESDGDTLSIGAMTTYDEIASADAVAEGAPALAEAAAAVGDVQVRNMGTIGGNIAHADPASDLPGAVIAERATVVVQGADGEREVAADDFFGGMYETDVGPGELVTRIEVPANADAGAYVKKAASASGYAVLGVAVALQLDGDTVASASVAANGAMDRAVRLAGVEDALAGADLTDDARDAAAGHATDGLDESRLMDDLEASASFRAHLLEVYTGRALAAASPDATAAGAAD
jgi:carbon-monoxide dehydrogenase medium subunit